MSTGLERFVDSLGKSLNIKKFDVETELVLLSKEISTDITTIPYEILKEYLILKEESISILESLEKLTLEAVDASEKKLDELSEELFNKATLFESENKEVLKIDNFSKRELLKLATKNYTEKNNPEIKNEAEKEEVIDMKDTKAPVVGNPLYEAFFNVDLEVDINEERKTQIKKEIAALKADIEIKMRTVVELNTEYKELG